MMVKEFNLSEKICNPNIIRVRDVKEFIRLLKEKFYMQYTDSAYPKEINKEIDKLAGLKLI